MKRILNLLAVTTLGVSSTFSVVSCNSNPVETKKNYTALEYVDGIKNYDIEITGEDSYSSNIIWEQYELADEHFVYDQATIDGVEYIVVYPFQTMFYAGQGSANDFVDYISSPMLFERKLDTIPENVVDPFINGTTFKTKSQNSLVDIYAFGIEKSKMSILDQLENLVKEAVPGWNSDDEVAIEESYKKDAELLVSFFLENGGLIISNTNVKLTIENHLSTSI